MKTKKIAELGLSTLLSVFALFVVAVPKVNAATVTWTGADSDSMNSGLNWLSGGILVDGDTAVFPASADFQMPNNDTTGLSLVKLIFNGAHAGSSSKSYTISGNSLTLTEGIDAVMTGNGGDHQVLTDIALNGAATFSTSGSNTLTVGDIGKLLDLGSNNLTLDASGGTITLVGKITGSGNIIKSGSGKVVFNLTNDSTPYSGSVAVSAGEFIADDTLPVGITLSGGKLKGTGTVGAVSMSGGAVAPGLSPGCLNSGNLTYTGGSLEVEVAGATACTDYDQQTVTGTVSLGTATALNVSLLNGFTPTSGQTYTIIENDGTDAVSGTFSGLAEGATVTSGSSSFTISYIGGTGNDIVLTVSGSVPGAPNTGFQVLASNPIILMSATVLASGTILVIARHYNRLGVKR